MKDRFVGFSKPSKNRVSVWTFNATPSREDEK